MVKVEEGSALALQAWTNPPDGGIGVDPRSPYVDRFWLPAIGPVAVCAARLLIPLADLVTGLGLAPGPASCETVAQALRTLTEAGVVAVSVEGTVLVRSELPYLGSGELARLPEALRAAHQASFALRADAPPGGGATALAPSARLLSLGATVDEIVTNPDLQPRQLAYRWQHVVRLAEEARDEAMTCWADPDLEIALVGCQGSAQAVREATWSAQHSIASRGLLPDTCRSHLADATAGVIDWLVSEFPSAGGPMPVDLPDR